MLTLRQRIFIISGVTVGLVVAITLALIYSSNKEPASETVQQSAKDTGGVEVDKIGTVDAQINVLSEQRQASYVPEEQMARQTARMFVERFGSFSNYNKNSHIQDVLDMATPNMQSWIKTQTINPGNNYEGITTRVLSLTIRSLNKGTAAVGIETQRTISAQVDGQLTTSIENKSGRVELVKVGGEWKVSGFYWE